jgi:hypothetical protein
MKIGFTGTKEALTQYQKDTLTELIKELSPTEAHHGDCIGADSFFDSVCKDLGIKRVIHPPEVDRYRAFCDGEEILPEKAYLKRNHDIVDAVDMMLATPKDSEVLRSGTWATVRYSKKKGKIKEDHIIYPGPGEFWLW